MKYHTPAVFVTAFWIPSLSAATFVIGDYYQSDGSDVLGSSTGTSNTEITTEYHANSGTPGNPSNYNGILVGARYGDSNNIWRSHHTFNLGNLPAAPSGQIYIIDGIKLSFEKSGDRPQATINAHESDGLLIGAISTPPDGSKLMSANQSGTFENIPLTSWTLDLNADNDYALVLDAPNASSGEYKTFGSGLSPASGPNIGIAGTITPSLAPVMIIDYHFEPDIASVPEPTASLMMVALLSLISLRRRR